MHKRNDGTGQIIVFGKLMTTFVVAPIDINKPQLLHLADLLWLAK